MPIHQEVTLTTAEGFALLGRMATLGEPLELVEASATAAPTGDNTDRLPFIVYLGEAETHAAVVLRADGTYSVHAVLELPGGEG